MNLNSDSGSRKMQSGSVWPLSERHCLVGSGHALELKSAICLALAELLRMCLLWNWMTFFTSSGTMVMFCQQSSAWCWIFVHLWLRDFFPYKANHWDCHFRDSVPYKANHFRDCVINKTSSMSCFSNKNALHFSVPCTQQRLSCCPAVPGLLLANQKTWGV